MKVKIKDYEYEVIETNDITDNDMFDNKGKPINFGKFLPLPQQIKVLKDMAFVHKKRTLIHELTHAFLFVYAPFQKSYNEENICEIMSTYAEDILKIVNDYFKRTTK